MTDCESPAWTDSARSGCRGRIKATPSGSGRVLKSLFNSVTCNGQNGAAATETAHPPGLVYCTAMVARPAPSMARVCKELQ